MCVCFVYVHQHVTVKIVATIMAFYGYIHNTRYSGQYHTCSGTMSTVTIGVLGIVSTKILNANHLKMRQVNLAVLKYCV